MGIRAYELEGPERSSVLPEAGADCSYLLKDRPPLCSSLPCCPAGVGTWSAAGSGDPRWGRGSPWMAFLWETSLCLSLDTTEA